MEDDARPSQLLPYLYIGSRAHAKDRGMLRSLGVKRILNATPTRSADPGGGVANFFEKEGTITYKRVPIYDNRGEGLTAHLDSSIAFIDQGKYYGNVLVHCRQGVSRSVAIVVAYLMKTRGLPLDDALAYVRRHRSVANPHEAFLQQLRDYDAALRRERAKRAADGHPDTFPQDLLDNRASASPPHGPMGPTRCPATAAAGPARGPKLPAAPAAKAPTPAMRGPSGPPRMPAGAAGPPQRATPVPANATANAKGEQAAVDAAGSSAAATAAEASGGSGGAIGPAMPPHLMRKRRERSDGDEEAGKQPRLG